MRVHAAGDEEAGAVRLVQLGQVAGGDDGARAVVDGGVRDRQPGQLGDAVWYSNITWSPPCGDLGLVGRVGREELRAGEDRVDERRHVVVVHAGAEEGDLVLRGDVAGGQVAQVA